MTVETSKLKGVWKEIKQRCYNTNHKHYDRYGGRGITMCDEWLNSFDQFALDMGNKPTSNHSIDRIDNDKGYCKENCRWATKLTQILNRESTIKAKGYTKSGKGFLARARVNGTRKMKYFSSEEEARRWYEENRITV